MTGTATTPLRDLSQCSPRRDPEHWDKILKGILYKDFVPVFTRTNTRTPLLNRHRVERQGDAKIGALARLCTRALIISLENGEPTS